MWTRENLGQRSRATVQLIVDHSPSRRQVAEFAIYSTVTMTGIALLVVGCLGAVGTALTIALSFPVLIVSIPVFVALAAVLLLGTVGMLSAGCFGLAAFTWVSWMSEYINGRHPVGSDVVDGVKTIILYTASELKRTARQFSKMSEEHFISTKQLVQEQFSNALEYIQFRANQHTMVAPGF